MTHDWSFTSTLPASAADELYDIIKPWVLRQLEGDGTPPADIAYVTTQVTEQIARDAGLLNIRNGQPFVRKLKANVTDFWIYPQEGEHRTRKIEILNRYGSYLICRRDCFSDVDAPVKRVKTTYYLFDYDKAAETLYVLREKVSSSRVRTIIKELEATAEDLVRTSRRKPSLMCSTGLRGDP